MKHDQGLFGAGPLCRRKLKRTKWGNGPTELHEAISSFGTKDRTRRLSDGEFYRQLGQEVEYAVGRGNCYFASAMNNFGKVFKALFS